MNNNKINSLYELIKQKSKEKGWKLEKETFKEWFDYYWDNAQVEYKQNIPYTIYTAIKEIEEIRNKDSDWWSREGIFDKMVRKPVFKIMDDPNYYEEASFLSLAQELLQCLRENLISKMAFISTSFKDSDSRKRKKFNKTFAKFPNTELTIKERNLSSKGNKLQRWQWIKEKHSDFDIFIDDNPTIINDAQENLPLDKLFLIPDYKLNLPNIKKESNIYFLKNSVSDLINQDFSIAALEVKNKQLEKELATTKQERERESNLLDYWYNGSGFFGNFVSDILRKKEVNQAKKII